MTTTAQPRPNAASTRDRLASSLREAGDTRISDFTLTAMFVVMILAPGTPFGLHLIAAAALVVVASFRRPTRPLVGATSYVGICIATVLYLALNTLIFSPDFESLTRLARIVLVMFMATYLASGRIDIKSGLRGMAAALLVNVPLFYAGVLPDNYRGVLTGFLGDKNVSGLTYAICSILLLALAKSWLARGSILMIGGVCVFLTDSRTSMAALAAGVIWLVATRFLKGTFFRSLLAVALYVAFDFAETNLARLGQYSDRSGSDALRERIDQASLEKTLAAPWNGHGLGEAVVEVAGDPWFFHNAYWGLITEGGYFLLIAVLAIVAIAGLQVLAPGHATFESRIVQSATITLLLCSFRLGETFFTLPAFVLVGVGLAVRTERYREWTESRRDADGEHVRATAQ